MKARIGRDKLSGPVRPTLTKQLAMTNRGRMDHAVFLILWSVFFLQNASAQTYEWEIDKNNRLAEQRAQQKDSAWKQMKGKWELGLTYGSWFFLSDARSTDDERFFFPQYFSVWEFGIAWHIQERLSTELAVGIQLNSNAPPTPDISTILSGEEVDLEGSGGGFFPVSASVRYDITQGQWRPFVGVGVGIVLGNAQYIKAQGTFPNDIERTTLQTAGNAPFGKLQAGVDYRAGRHFNLSMSCSYDHSRDFDEPLGGYLRYQGLRANVGLGVVF